MILLPDFRHSQKGYIGLTLVFFLVVLSMILYPWVYPKKEEEATGCIVGEAGNPNDRLTGIPAIKERDRPPQGVYNNILIGGVDPEKKANYVLIRKNVWILKKDPFHSEWLILGDNTVNIAYLHTWDAGVTSQKPGYEMYYPGTWGEINTKKGSILLRHEGIIFLVNKDPATTQTLPWGEEEDEDGNPKPRENSIYTADVYQDEEIYNKTDKRYKTPDLFDCMKKAPETSFLPDDLLQATASATKVLIPSQSKSPDQEQLQLEWFVFKQNAGGIWDVHCKPAIYLYPPEKMMVNVKVIPSGFLTYTDPPYDPDKGWNVLAYPSGKLEIPNSKFPIPNSQFDLGSQEKPRTASYAYLYFESKIRDEVIQKPTRGWVVKYEDLTNLYQNILPKLGLNEQQKNDFIEYWNKALSKDQSPYYFVGVIDQDNVNQIEKLEITPKPDSINRVRIYFERLDSPKVVQTPDLSSISNLKFKISNSHFNVVEWGGMVKNDKDHPFTCSQ